MSLPKVVKVKNLIGTSDNNSKDWKQYWELKTGVKFNLCSNILCNNKAEVGAHVIKVDSTDKSWYIVPFCKKCNHPLNNNTMMVTEFNLVKVVE